jgi:malonyl-CoA/methylmalonyl-CoA synthetase
MTDPLFPALLEPAPTEALRFGERSITYEQLARAVGRTAERAHGDQRIAVWAPPAIETCVAALGVVAAGAAAVPINPSLGRSELTHIIEDCGLRRIVAPAEDELPPAAARLERLAVELDGRDASLPPEPPPEAAALILYTSGTTGPPKGVVLSRRAIASNLDALFHVWEWAAEDVLVQGLPLFHVHGLVLGVFGPLRLASRLHHIGRFSPEMACRELSDEGTMLFAVPTMYHRLANAAEQDSRLGDALQRARILVSGSAPLPVREHARIESICGQKIVERYGLTETIMNCAVWASGDRRPGYVGPPLPGVELRLVDDDGATLDVDDDETIGEIVVRGPNLFSEYLNRPDDTAAAMRGGWFLTGDLATRAHDGYIRIVGRRATDLIKTGGYKVGAGEVEGALLEHEAVAEAAVVGEPEEDLGERIVAFVVPKQGMDPSANELQDHVAHTLAPHKRPRAVHFVAELPRNEMGKVRKADLKPGGLPPS